MIASMIDRTPWLAGLARRTQTLKDKEQRDYDAVAAFYDAHTTPLTDVFGRHTLELLGIEPGHRVLEIACGSGTLLPELAARAGLQGSVTGFDQSAGMLALARRRIAEHQARVELIQGDAEALAGVSPGHYDRVLSVFGLMYLPDPLAALKKIKAVLKPSGRAAITVWSLPEAVPGLTLPMEAGARVLPPPPIDWLMGTRPARRLLYKQLLRTKPGGGKSPMCLAPKGRLEKLMAAAGFTNPTRTEPSQTFRFEDIDAYWEVLMGTPARVLVQQHSPAKVAKVKALLRQLLDERHRSEDGRLMIPMGAVTVTGERQREDG